MAQAVRSPNLGFVAFFSDGKAEVLGLVRFVNRGVVDEDGMGVSGSGG